MNIAEVALNPGVAPDTHLGVQTELVHGARVGFEERSQAQRSSVSAPVFLKPSVP